MTGTAALPAGEPRPDVDPRHGLSTSEVAERVAAGLTNDVPAAPSRTTAQIVRANVLTRFNALMVALGVVPLALGSPGDALFLGVVIANSLIGSVQELRAKRTLDRLSVLSAPKAQIVRDGDLVELSLGELVLDDVIDLGAGDQVPADARVVVSDALEIDESLLTGEADPVAKDAGDDLLSGSFVVSGRGRAQVTKVGRDAYAARLAEEARRFTLVRSPLMANINQIIRVVTWILVPTAVLQLVMSTFFSDETLRESLLSAVASVVGMVPEGLVLLTSVAFAVGVVRLGRRRTLVQELPAIEVLARVDTLCIDKTGTITEGSLDLKELQPLDGRVGRGEAGHSAGPALAAMAAAEPDPNATMQAVARAWPEAPGWTLTGRVPFSSARKWSAYLFDGHGTWVLGAPEMVLGDGFDGVRPQVDAGAEAGYRVLVLAHADAAPSGSDLPEGVAPIGLVLFEDRVRADAPRTLAYFDEQGVQLKVISGDNPTTVAAVAGRAGLRDGDEPFDARQLPDDPEALAATLEEHDVFGRVTPHQKQAMVGALQSNGRTVAMTGDGVNDVLALKDSDCGIAMASGSEATRAVAQLVLLDSNFAALPHVVGEGRRVINNIERVASLFLTKTTYATVLAVLTGILGLTYPFLPRHLTLISTLTIGIPAFFLALAPNRDLVHEGFLPRVTRIAVPGGLLAATAAFTTYAVSMLDDEPIAEHRSGAVLAAGGVAFLVLIRVARPLTPLRVVLIGSMIGLFLGAFALPAARDVFQLEWPGVNDAAVAGACVAVAWPLLGVGERLVARVQAWWSARQAERAGAADVRPAP